MVFFLTLLEFLTRATHELVSIWTCWDHALTSARTYDNPHTDEVVFVTWRGPDGQILQNYGFGMTKMSFASGVCSLLLGYGDGRRAVQMRQTRDYIIKGNC